MKSKPRGTAKTPKKGPKKTPRNRTGTDGNRLKVLRAKLAGFAEELGDIIDGMDGLDLDASGHDLGLDEMLADLVDLAERMADSDARK